MPDSRPTPQHERSRGSRARGEAALVARYIHELSERHGGAGDDGLERGPAEDGPDVTAGRFGGTP